MEDGRCLLDVINDPQALNDFLNSTDDEDSKLDPPTPNYDHSSPSPSQPQWTLSNGNNDIGATPQQQQILNQTPSNKVIQGIQNTMGVSPRTASPLLQVGAQQLFVKSTPPSSQQPPQVQLNQVAAMPQTHFVAQAATLPQNQTVHQLVQLQNQTPGQQAQIIQQGTGSPQTVILQQTPTRPQQNVVNVGQIRTTAPQQGINIVQGTTPSQISLQGTLIQTSAGKFLIQGQALVGQQVHVPGLGNIVLRPQVQSLQNIQTVQSNIVSSTTVPQSNSATAQLNAQQAQVNGHVGTIGGQQIVLQGANQNQGLVLQTLPNVVKMQPGNGSVSATGGNVSNQQGLILTRAITSQPQAAQGASPATQTVLHRPLNQPSSANVSLNIGGQVVNLAQLQHVQQKGGQPAIVGHSSNTASNSSTIQTTAGASIINQAATVQQQQQTQQNQGVAVQNFTGTPPSQNNMQSSKTFIIHTQTPQSMAQNYNGPQKTQQQLLQPQSQPQLQQGQVFTRQGGQASLQSSPQISVSSNLTNLQTIQQPQQQQHNNHIGNGDAPTNQGVIVNANMTVDSNNVNNQLQQGVAVMNTNTNTKQLGGGDNQQRVQNAQHVLARLQMQLKHLQSIPEPSEQQQRLIKRLQELMSQVVAQTRQQIQQQGNQQQQASSQQQPQQQQQQQGSAPSLSTLLVQQNNGATSSLQTSTSAGQPQSQSQTVLSLPQVIQNISVQSSNQPPAGKLPIPALTKVEQVLNKLTPEQREKLQSQLSRLTPEQQQLFYKHQQTLILQKLSQQKPVQTIAGANSKVPIMVQQINKGVSQLRPIIIQQQQGSSQPAQAQQKDEARGVKRPSSVLLQQMARDHQGVLKPDCRTPFKTYRDCVKRLMRYHIYHEKDAEPSVLKKADGEFEVQSQDFLDRYQGMLVKYRDLLWQDSMRKDPSAEMVMLDRIFIQDENKQLAKDKQLVLENPDAFEPMPILKPSEEEIKEEKTEDIGEDSGGDEKIDIKKEFEEEPLPFSAYEYESGVKSEPLDCVGGSGPVKKEDSTLNVKNEPEANYYRETNAVGAATESKVIPKLKISLKSERTPSPSPSPTPSPVEDKWKSNFEESANGRNDSDLERLSDSANDEELSDTKAECMSNSEQKNHWFEDRYLSDHSDNATDNTNLHSEMTSNHLVTNPYDYEDISSDFNGNLDDSPAPYTDSGSGRGNRTEVDTALEGLFTSSDLETGHSSKDYIDYKSQCDNTDHIDYKSQCDNKEPVSKDRLSNELDSAINSLAVEFGEEGGSEQNESFININNHMDMDSPMGHQSERDLESDRDSQDDSELNTSQELEHADMSTAVDDADNHGISDISSYFPHHDAHSFHSPECSMETGDLNTEMESAINSILSLQGGEVSVDPVIGHPVAVQPYVAQFDEETDLEPEESAIDEPVMVDDLDAAVQSILM